MSWLLREISYGGACPKGYGMCWRNWNRHTIMAAPVPLNLILCFFRDVQFWIQFKSHSHREEMEQKWYQNGYETGFKEGEHRASTNCLKNYQSIVENKNIGLGL